MQREAAQQAEPSEPGTAPGPPSSLLDASAVQHVLALQRTAGNRAVGEVLARRAAPRMVARDGDKPWTSKVGGEYEYKLEHKGERTSWSVRLSFSKAETSPIKGATPDKDVKAQLFASKVSRTKTAGAKACNSMAIALGKVDLTIAQPWPGITVNTDLKAFEAKVESGKLDVNVFKLGVMVQGKFSKDLKGTALGDLVMSTELGKLIEEGTVIKVQGRFEVNIDPSDVARLARLVRANSKMVRETSRGLKAKKALDALESQQKALRSQLRKRGGKLSKAAINRIEKRLAANAAKIKTLGQRIAKSKAAVKVLEATAKAAAKGLKSKAGRLVGAAIAKVGGKLLLKLVPGLNLVLLAVDIWSVGSALYDLFTGKKRLGLPTGGEGGEGKGEGEAGGGKGGGGTGGETELPPEISIDDSADAGEPQPGEPLTEGAKKLLEKLATGKGGMRVTGEELEDLNMLVPADVSDEEAAELAARFKSASKADAGDPFAGLGGLVDEVRTARAGTSSTTATDASGTVKLDDPEKTPTPADDVGPDGRAHKPATPAVTGKGDQGEGGGKGKGKAEDAGGAGGKGKGAGAGGADKGKGGSKGKGLREQSTQTAAGKLYYPEASEPAGENVSKFQFRVISGYSPNANYAKGSVVAIKIQFEKGAQSYTAGFDVRVVSHTKTDEKIVFEAVNVRRWRISGTALDMPANEPVTITSVRGDGGAPKKPAAKK